MVFPCFSNIFGVPAGFSLHLQVAMGNYPYALDLFGQGLPGWPLKAVCEPRNFQQLAPLEFLANAVGSYYNATGGRMTGYIHVILAKQQ
jgi:hypothetical protein